MAKRKPPANHPQQSEPDGSPRDPAKGLLWLYGLHATLAAVANPARLCRRLVATALVGERLAAAAVSAGSARPRVEILKRHDLEALLPAGAVHQGVAALVEPLAEISLDAVLARLAEAPHACLVFLDQATDPRNVGAVLRAAAAFAADAVVVQDRHAPPATGALAKAASGALETVPLIRVVNLARALAATKDAGFWCVGLDGTADRTLVDADLGGRIGLVLGAEGSGLRRLTRETCDFLIRIPIAPAADSLNLATAAAIALYERARHHG